MTQDLSGKIFIVDNVLNKSECDELIHCYNLNGPTHQWDNFFPMTIDMDNQYLRNHILKIQNTINEFLKDNLVVDWCEIVRWPVGSFKLPHKDITSKETTFTSVTYLNDDYEGGETYIVDDIKIVPKAGRTFFFDGVFYTHGVTEVKKYDRYTIPIWYKKEHDS